MIGSNTPTQSEGQIISLFPTPLYTYKLEDNEYDIVQNELQRVVTNFYLDKQWGQNTEWDSKTQFLSNKGDFSESVLKENNMPIVTSFIMNHCVAYMSLMNVKNNINL